MNLNTVELEHGGFVVKRSQSGNLLGQVLSYGYMGNVRVLCARTSLGTHDFLVRSGSREEYPLVHKSFRIFFPELNMPHPVPQSSRIS